MHNSHLVKFYVYRRKSIVFEYTTSDRFLIPIVDLFDNKAVVLYDNIYFKLSDLNKCFKLSIDKTNSQTIKNELLSLFKSRIRYAKQFSAQFQAHPRIDICYADDKDIISFIRYIRKCDLRKFVVYLASTFKLNKNQSFSLYKAGLNEKQITLSLRTLFDDTTTELYRVINEKDIYKMIYDAVREYTRKENES
ncbi:MAG: hypothetical protein ACI4V7_06500 [Succinivibrionaceae bacterium]